MHDVLDEASERETGATMTNVVEVHFFGGPFDGLVQGWNVERTLPKKLRMSINLAHSRGGIRMDVTGPSACGALLAHESAHDEVVYRQQEPGFYYFEKLGKGDGEDELAAA